MMAEMFNEDFLISSPEYGNILENAVIPELKDVQENLTVSGKDGVSL